MNQTFDGLTLVVPEKRDVERDAVCDHWRHKGGSILRLSRFWEPPSIDVTTVRLYGPDTFCLVVAQKLGLDLLSPDDALIATLDQRWLKREITQTILGNVGCCAFPLFVKPVVPKAFRAAVYESPDLLLAECQGLEPDTPVLTSNPVEILAEARCFILDRSVTTCAIYEGDGSVDDAISIATEVAADYSLPDTYVADLAFIANRGWAILEFNAAWGAGLNGCDATRVASCLERATRVSGSPQSAAQQ